MEAYPELSFPRYEEPPKLQGCGIVSLLPLDWQLISLAECAPISSQQSQQDEDTRALLKHLNAYYPKEEKGEHQPDYNNVQVYESKSISN